MARAAAAPLAPSRLLVSLIAVTVCLAGGVHSQARCSVPGGGGGYCLDLHQCQQHLDLLTAIRAGREPIAAYGRLQALTCAYRGYKPLLCCPDATSGQSLLPTDCGVTANPDRIVGGVDAPLGGWPWITLLYGRETPASEPNFFCGGTLINSRYVLTAAHCFPGGNTAAVELVRLGEHRVSRDTDCEVPTFGATVCAPQPQDIRPEAVVIHSQYNRPCRYCNDIALIRLSLPPKLHDYVRPICLPLQPLQQMGFSREQFVYKQADVAGWGSVTKDPYNVFQPDVLQQAKLLIKPCQGGFGQVCAEGQQQDTCRGDSGGPMMLSDVYGQKFYLVGITSFGNQVCATASSLSTFTDVNYFASWIMANLRP